MVKRIRWERPLQGWKKLNMDGAFNGDIGLVGCGGIVRDERGWWVNGFRKQIGITPSIHAAAQGCYRCNVLTSDAQRLGLVDYSHEHAM